MNLVTNLLATVKPSDGTPEGLYVASWVIFGVACVAAVLAVLLRMQSGGCSVVEVRFALAAIIIGCIPLAWEIHLYRIDYFPVARDGTPASPPIWQALAIPALPVLCGCCLLMLKRKQ